MDVSFQLLSTMSPKVSKNVKPKPSKKAPTKLALKKHFRKSFQLDHTISTKYEQLQLEEQESTSCSNESTQGEEIILNEKPIEISDDEVNLTEYVLPEKPDLSKFPEVARYFSSFAKPSAKDFSKMHELENGNNGLLDSYNNCSINRANNSGEDPIDEDVNDSFNGLEPNKNGENTAEAVWYDNGDSDPIIIEDSIIEKSYEDNLNDVDGPISQEQVELFNISHASYHEDEEANKERILKWVADSCKDLVNSFTEPEKCNGTLVDITNEDSIKDIEKDKCDPIDEIDKGNEPISEDTIVDSFADNTQTNISRTPENGQNHLYESILDNIYGKSWRSNKETILLQSEPRPKKETVDKIQIPQTERKPNKRMLGHQQLFKAARTMLNIESPQYNSFSNEEKTVKQKEEIDNSKSIVHLDETESLLDQLYGSEWRSKKEEILTPVVARNKSVNNTMNLEIPHMPFVTPRRKKNTRRLLADSYSDDWRPDLTQENLDKEEENIAIDLVSNLSTYNTSTNSISKEVGSSLKESASLNSSSKDIANSKPPNKIVGMVQFNEEEVLKTLKSRPPNAPVESSKKKFVIESSDSELDTQKSILGSPVPSLNTRVRLMRRKIIPSSDDDDSESDAESNLEPETELNNINNKLYERHPKDKDAGSAETDGKKKPAKPQTEKKSKKENFPVSATQSSDLQKQDLGVGQYPSFLASLSKNVNYHDIKLKYRPYRSDYQTNKEKLGKMLFDYFNRYVFENKIPADTPLQWNDRMRGTAGFCYCKKITRRTGEVERSCRIVLATKILDSPDRLRDTLVHEMCHAATWIVNEVGDGHGPFWKAWADKAMKKFPELPPIRRCHDYAINTKFSYVCTQCKYTIGRHSKSLDIEAKRCGYCYGKFELFINKKKNGVSIRVPVKSGAKQTTGFALFVKENYSRVKQPMLKHGDVMKILSEEFAAMKVKDN